MDFEISPSLDKKLGKIKAKDKFLFQKVSKQLLLFKKNHLHPSLKIHKLTGKFNNIWSMSIGKSHRMLFSLDEDGAYFFKIGDHNEVYKNN